LKKVKYLPPYPKIGTTIDLLKLSKVIDKAAILLNAAPLRGIMTEKAVVGLSEIIPVAPIYISACC
jgi:hypothetical protein